MGGCTGSGCSDVLVEASLLLEPLIVPLMMCTHQSSLLVNVDGLVIRSSELSLELDSPVQLADIAAKFLLILF